MIYLQPSLDLLTAAHHVVYGRVQIPPPGLQGLLYHLHGSVREHGLQMIDRLCLLGGQVIPEPLTHLLLRLPPSEVQYHCWSTDYWAR